MSNFSAEMQAYIAASREKPVAYRPSFARIARSVGAGVWLSQLCYWDGKESNGEGWIFKTVPEFEAETGMSEREQETARRRWNELGVVEISKRGLPAMPCYRIDWTRLMELSANAPARSESASQVRTDCPNLSGRSQAGLVRTDCPNTHTENTNRDYKTERGSASRRARPTVQAPPVLKNQPRPGAKRAAWSGPTPMPAPIAAWYACTKDTAELNTVQADSIVAAVTDVDLWSRVLTKAMLYHRRPNVATFLDYYRAGDVPDYRAERAARTKAQASDTITDKLTRAAAMAGFNLGEHVPDHHEAAQAVADAGGF